MKIYFLVATQQDNLGDLLINKMLIDELAKYAVVFVDAAGLPNSFQEVLLREKNVKNFEEEYNDSLKRMTGLKLLPKVKKDFTHYFKSPGPSGGFGYDFKSIARALVLAYQFNYLTKGNIKLNLVGNDIIMKTKLDHWFQKNTNICFENYLVRSTKNRDQMIEKGYRNIGFIPDLAFLYQTETNHRKKDEVLISLRNLGDLTYKDKIISNLKEIIPFYINLGLKVTFFYQVESDENFNTELYTKFKSDQVFFKDKCLKYDEIHNYHAAKYVITNRLHVMILGIMHNAVPLLILNDDAKTSKINRILSDNKLNNLILKDKNTFHKIENDFDKIALTIDKVLISNQQNCQQVIKSLF